MSNSEWLRKETTDHKRRIIPNDSDTEESIPEEEDDDKKQEKSRSSASLDADTVALYELFQEDAVTTAAADPKESSPRSRGTLEILKKYVTLGMVQSGQLCSVVRSYIVHHMVGSVHYRLIVNPDNQICLEALGDKSAPTGKSLLNRTYKEWFLNTKLYQKAGASQHALPRSVSSIYEVIRMHYQLKNHPYIVIAVPLSELHILKRSLQDWEPMCDLPILNRSTENGISTPIYSQPVRKKQKTSSSPSKDNPFQINIAVYDAFSVENIQKPNAEGKVYLPNSTHYGIQLRNRLYRSAAAAVYVDGIFQGEFLLQARETIILKRPVHTNSSFLFLCQHKEAVTDCSESHIQVRFVPEHERDYLVQLQRSDIEKRDEAAPDPCPGSTYLSEPNDQVIHSSIRARFNESEAVTLHIRLVALAFSQPTIKPLTDCRTFMSYSASSSSSSTLKGKAQEQKACKIKTMGFM